MPHHAIRPSSATRHPRAFATRPRAALPALLTAALASSAPLAADDGVPITLAFAGEFAGQPFDCAATFDDVGAGGASVTVSDYRLYVSRVRLLDASGAETPVALDDDGRWQDGEVALLDFEDATEHCINGTAETNATLAGRAPAGDYTGVAFDIGVPFERNHGDATLAGSPLNLTAMFWNWRGGYRFLRVDLAPAGNADAMGTTHGEAMRAGAPDGDDMVAGQAAGSHGMAKHGGRMTGAGHGGGGWAMHVGSTGCAAPTPTTAPDACAAPNRIEVVLNDFDPASGTIVIDPARALAGVDVSENTPETAPGCMSSPDDPECGTVLEALGLGTGGTPQTLATGR